MNRIKLLGGLIIALCILFSGVLMIYLQMEGYKNCEISTCGAIPFMYFITAPFFTSGALGILFSTLISTEESALLPETRQSLKTIRFISILSIITWIVPLLLMFVYLPTN